MCDCRQTRRFECFAAPDGAFLVFDVGAGHPADIEGHVLIGLAHEDAAWIAHLLERGERPGEAYLAALKLPRG